MLSANNGNGFVFQSLFESLEDRVLFDGVPDATFVLPQADVQEPVPAQVQDVQQADISGPRELILIDANVENSEQLLAGILESKPDSILEIRIIESDQDGVSQITQLLADAEGQYDAIHIVSHGSEGEVNLGNSRLTADNLDSYSGLLATWAGALTEDADLLFYGCDLAGNAEGTQFIEAISEITGADVAASDDLTGAADQGGDWDLELNVGTVETAAFSASAFDGILLGDTDGDGLDHVDDLDDDNDGILDVDEGFSITTETLDLSTYQSGELVQTFSVNPDIDARITITSTNGTFVTVGGEQTPAFDPADTGFVGNEDNLLVVFDPPNGAPSPVVVTVEFFEAGTTNAVVVNGISTQVSDIDSSNPSDPDTGRRDRVTVDAFAAGTAQSVDLALVDPANATLEIVGNVATALDDDAATSFNDDDGSITVTTGPVDSIVFLYDEITGSVNPAPRGIGILGDFTIDIPVVRDTDGDGIADHKDLDSDNDGISDLVESGDAPGIAADINGDGFIDLTEGVDTDGDGLMDVFEDGNLAANVGTTPIDFDGDLIDDYLDLDSDDDGIPDTIEAFPTVGYVTNDGDVTNDDSDGDGILDVFDSSPGHGGDFSTPENTDGFGVADFRDTDSDEDGILDSIESGQTLSGNDADMDGIDDAVNASYADPDGDVNVPISDLENTTDTDLSDADYRSVDLQDKDGDGVADVNDLDDDNDGILDTEEGQDVTADLNWAGSGADGQSFTLTDLSGSGVDVDFSSSYTSGAASGGAPVLGNEGLVIFTEFEELAAEDPNEHGFYTLDFSEDVILTSFSIKDIDRRASFIDAYTVIAEDADGNFVRLNFTPGSALIQDVEGFYYHDGDFNSGDIDQDHWLTVDSGGAAIRSLTVIASPSEGGFGGGLLANPSRVVLGDLELISFTDTDGDGTPDHCDLDSDNDGISDLVESGADASVVDVDGDGVYDNTTGAGAQVDANGVPIAANGGVAPVDSDGDGLDDYLDLDSDDDGIPDTVEAFPTAGFVTNDGDVTNDDSDGDGVLDVFDATPGHGADFTTPEDTDADGTADFLDTDSDNDGLIDTVESGLSLTGVDANGDGIDDGVNASYADPDGDIDVPISDLANVDTDATDADYRSLNDKDGDGVADINDLDDDNDGITDVEEGQIAELVTFSNALDGTTPVNDVIVDTIFFDGVGNVDEQRFDNDNFTFATGATAIPGKNFNFNEDELAVLDAGGQYDLTFDYSGQALVSEVFLHLNSFDSIRLELLAAENPNIGFEVLSGSNFNQLGTNGDLSFGDDDQTTFDTSAGQERQNGLGGGSADGTIRFFSLDGSPITQLDFNLVGQPGRMTTGEGWQLAMEVISSRDTDMDGVADHCDLDSDNDGISDLVESGQDPSVVDVNGDGIHDGPVDPTTGIPLAANGGAGVDPVDSDMDGINDYLDLDSDDDGIPDIVEAQPTGTYVALTGFDADGDGVDDAFDMTVGFGGDFTPVENTDGADNPDYLDTNSDNDGLIDSAESGLTLTGVDANGDGIDDGVNASYLDPDGDVNDPTVDLDNEGGDTTEVAYREVIADLVTVKTLISGDDTPDEGESVTFQIEVTNNGGAQATGVSLSDSLPTGITFANSSTSAGTTYNADTGVWTIGTLADGGSAILTLTGTVDVGQGGNMITNTTSAAMGDQDDPSTVGDDLVESVTINNVADLVTVKTLLSGDSTPDEGDLVTFLIEVTNSGAAQATNIELMDLLPTGLTAAANNGTISQGTYSATTGLWEIGTLANGATATLTLRGTVDVGQGGTTITNMTTAATGDQTDLSTAGDDLVESVMVNNIADLVTVKTLASGDSTPDEGDIVTFQIVVTNNGVAQATGVSLVGLVAYRSDGDRSQRQCDSRVLRSSVRFVRHRNAQSRCFGNVNAARNG